MDAPDRARRGKPPRRFVLRRSGSARTRHCEERLRRSNPAFFVASRKLDCFAALAMTAVGIAPCGRYCGAGFPNPASARSSRAMTAVSVDDALNRHSGASRSDEPGIHNHDREYGFRACAKRRIYDAQLRIGEMTMNGQGARRLK